MGFNFGSIFSAPQNLFWYACFLPPLSLIACVIAGTVLDHYLILDTPIVATILTYSPERYIFGCTSFVVCILICVCAYRLFRFLSTGSRRLPNQSLTDTVLVYSVAVLGFIVSLAYGCISFFTLQEGVKLHFRIEIFAFILLTVFYLYCDFLFNKKRIPVSNQSWILDGFLLTLVVAYAVTVYLSIEKNMQPIFKYASIIGYAVLLLIFVKFPVLAKTYLGPKFSLSSKKVQAKKK